MEVVVPDRAFDSYNGVKERLYKQQSSDLRIGVITSQEKPGAAKLTIENGNRRLSKRPLG